MKPIQNPANPNPHCESRSPAHGFRYRTESSSPPPTYLEGSGIHEIDDAAF